MRNKQKIFLINGTFKYVKRTIPPTRVHVAYVRHTPEYSNVVITEAEGHSYRLAKKKALKWLLED